MKISIKRVIDFPTEAQMEIRKWRNNETIAKHFIIPHIEEETHRNWLESQKKEKPSTIAFFICDENNNRLGCTYISHIDYENLTCEPGTFLNPDIFLEGCGTVAGYLLNNFIFNNLNMYKINVRVLGENKKIVSMHKRSGYTLEGILREQILKDNQRLDVYLFSISKKEWAERGPFVYELIKSYL